MARYGKKSQESVERAMHRMKRGQLKSGKDGKGGTVTSPAQAIAIGLSEAREKGAKVPSEWSSKKSTAKKRTGKKRTAKKRTTSTRSSSKRGRRKTARSSRKSSRSN